MINFRQMTLWERFKRWWDPVKYGREDEKLRAAIKYLVEHPDVPCAIDGKEIKP